MRTKPGRTTSTPTGPDWTWLARAGPVRSVCPRLSPRGVTRFLIYLFLKSKTSHGYIFSKKYVFLICLLVFKNIFFEKATAPSGPNLVTLDVWGWGFCNDKLKRLTNIVPGEPDNGGGGGLSIPSVIQQNVCGPRSRPWAGGC